jgi:hypothetical protein
MPLLAAILGSWAVVAAVRAGRCRNRGAGLALGILVGVVLYFGRYQVALVHELGPSAIVRLDLLPQYVALRQREEVVEDTRTRREAEPNEALNWVLLAAEAGLVVVLVGVAGWVATGRVYCERCARWSDRALAYFYPGHGEKILRALARREWEALATLPVFVPETMSQNAFTVLALETCSGECPAHVSVKEVRSGGGAFEFGRYDSAMGKMLLRQRVVTGEDLAAIRANLPRG